MCHKQKCGRKIFSQRPFKSSMDERNEEKISARIIG